MEIEITALLDLDQFALSHSQAEGGPFAGRDTWNASLARAAETALLDTPEKLQAMRDYALASGGWDEEEVSTWDDTELNALFLQWVAGDVRQCPAKLDDGELVEREPGVWFWEDEDEECGPFETRSDAYENQIDSARPPRAESLEEIDWPEYEADASAGRISGNLFRSDDGRVYFTLDS